MGTIKATNIEPIADNGTVTLGSSGDTFSLGSGVVQSNLNYPAFFAHLSSSQSVSANTNTKIQFDTEIFDSDNCYDNSTNYRFTPTVAGKYFVYASCSCEAQTGGKNMLSQIRLLKNGSEYANPNATFTDGNVTRFIQTMTSVVDMNGSSDYLECDGKINVGSGSGEFNAGSKQTYFGAYRIGT